MKNKTYYNEVKSGKVVNIDRKLFPEEYNIKEVRIINQATIQEYVVGYVDNTPIAIVGIPEDVDTSSIVVRKNNSDVKFEYLPEDYIDHTEFSIYPYDEKYYNDNILKYTYKGLLEKRHNREVMEYKRKNKQKVKKK